LDFLPDWPAVVPFAPFLHRSASRLALGGDHPDRAAIFHRRQDPSRVSRVDPRSRAIPGPNPSVLVARTLRSIPNPSRSALFPKRENQRSNLPPNLPLSHPPPPPQRASVVTRGLRLPGQHERIPLPRGHGPVQARPRDQGYPPLPRKRVRRRVSLF
jgi:hypothetical protein